MDDICWGIFLNVLDVYNTWTWERLARFAGVRWWLTHTVRQPLRPSSCPALASLWLSSSRHKVRSNQKSRTPVQIVVDPWSPEVRHHITKPLNIYIYISVVCSIILIGSSILHYKKRFIFLKPKNLTTTRL